MQGPTDEVNCNLKTHTVSADNNKDFSIYSDRRQKFDCKGKSGTCNVCSAPCSSCFHANKFLGESNDESAGETCAGNMVSGQLSVLSVVGMESTSESFSENAAVKEHSVFPNACVSDDTVIHSKSESRRSLEGHDDCLSCVSGTDEYANRKYESADSGINYKQAISGCISGKVSPTSSQTGVHSQKPDAENNDDATVSLKVQTTSQEPSEYLPLGQNQRDDNDFKTSDSKDKLMKDSTQHLNSTSPSGMASDAACADPPAVALNPTEKNVMDVENHTATETDDSDMVEQDVKVCDICGDAGREDLLAVCSQCSDGAEHTYCMLEMLDKVPEGDWLCEECKTLEQVEKKTKQEKMGRVDKNDEYNSSDQASENLNSSDVEDFRTKGSTKIAHKRLRDDDDPEVSSIIKKPALESIVGSPKTSNSSRIATLSSESSFKNLDRGKLQSPHSSSDIVQINGTTESAKPASDPRLRNIRGTFSKSNSFSSLNSKPKVKLVEQVAIQRQKSAKEHSSFRLKDGATRSIGRSMSFKPTTSSRSESKTKMLSPRQSHMQDIKHSNEKSTFERQRLFRTENPSNNSKMAPSMSFTSRIEKRPTSHAESSSFTNISNQHEVKPVQTDRRTAALSRSSSLAARRNGDLSSSKGQPDGLSRPKELTNAGDRMRESGSRIGPPSVKSSRDETDNLKAAIEAAVLKKPGVYRKHRASGRADESSMPTMGGGIVSHQDQISGVMKKKMFSDIGLPERPSALQNLNGEAGEPLKEETHNIVKQFSLAHVEGLSGGRDGAYTAFLSRDTSRIVPAVNPLLLKSLAIPEHEYIWQGCFEICRSGQIFDSWDGIQAHISTCASPKVMEAVKKFKSKVVLHEVSRLSTWPTQFQHGVREDDIAIFFFAKDLESHVKVYKVLLDNMMKNDRALKGNIDGIELLIFPSNQLPDNLKRWNMLFYLWGVLRVKKESYLQKKPESGNQYRAPQDIPDPIMSLPENRCSLRPITDNASQHVGVPASEELRPLMTSEIVERECNTGGSSSVQQEHGLNSSFSRTVQSDGTKQCQEMRGINQVGANSSHSLPVAVNGSFSATEVQLDASLNRLQSPHHLSESVVCIPEATASKGTTTFNETCNQNEVEKIFDARDLSTNGETPLGDTQNITDLNVEPSPWPFSHTDSMHPGSFVLPYVGTSLVSPRNPTDNESRGTLEKMNHAPSGSTHMETLNPYQNPERRFFPVELPTLSGSIPWKTHRLGEQQHNNKTPNLELALRAETLPLNLNLEPLSINKVDQKVNNECILEENAGGSKAEDDVSASLSLSLAFPFPETDLNTKPSPKTSMSWLGRNG